MASAWVVDVTEADFDARVLTASRDTPVVVDFWAPWCGPCRALAPLLEQAVNARQGDVLLAKVNTDDNPRLASKYQVDVLPTVIAFREGNIVLDFQGVLPERELALFLDRISPTQADKQAKAARNKEETEPAGAEADYRAILANAPHHGAAALGLARVLLSKTQLDEVAGLLDRVGTHGDLGAEAERLRAQLLMRQHSHNVADEATLRRRIAEEPKKAQHHYDLGCVLAAGGRHAEALESLYQAGLRDNKLASSHVREMMVKIFHLVGVQSDLANDYRERLTALLY